MDKPDHWDDVKTKLERLIQQDHLPSAFLATIEAYYLPLAVRIAERQRAADRCLLVAVNGAQGTGKSTLAEFLQLILADGYGLPCAKFSLDDIYLTKAQRLELAANVHPLLATRGVPGTHDLALGQATIDALMGSNGPVAIPKFDKAQDDRAPQQTWPKFQAPARVVLVEGWCMSAAPEQDSATLAAPINKLEQDEDSSSAWRSYVNQQLQGSYQDFFQQMDLLVMLKAPSMECVGEWRTLQEVKMAKRLNMHSVGAISQQLADEDWLDLPKTEATRGIMTKVQLQRFIMHYERLTRAMLREMPQRADVLFEINTDHEITGVHYAD